MDFHAAMETFAEAWVAANTPTAVNASEIPQVSPAEDIPSQIQMEQKIKKRSNTNSPGQGQTTAAASGVKSLPIHCVIEQTNGPLTFEPDNTATYNVELDTYAILPCTTLFSELLRTALIKLGYNANEAMNAKGAIQIKNWKPLSFETITEDNKSTVEDILGDLTQTAKLRIRLCSSPGLISPEKWTDQTVRCAVLALLKEMSQSTLAKLCPLTQSAISNIANWKYTSKVSAEKCREFGVWYKQYHSMKEIRGEKFGVPKDSRLTFHPQHEIPQMRKWFHSCKTPSDEKLKFFAGELNKGHVRQERPNVTVAKLKIWWKNERQREKRMQQQTPVENEALGGKSDEDESRPSTSSDELASTSKSYVELTNVSSDLLASELLCKNSFSSDGSNTGDLFHDADFH